MARNEKDSGQRKQHDDTQGGGGGSKGGGGRTKHAEGSKSEHSTNERTGSRTDEKGRN